MQDNNHHRSGTRYPHIPTDIVQCVFPQPLTHGVAVGMYKKNAERCGRHCIYKFAVTYSQILEQHE